MSSSLGTPVGTPVGVPSGHVEVEKENKNEEAAQLVSCRARGVGLWSWGKLGEEFAGCLLRVC